jgi:spore coat polysaccharide biosynthesis protein SpsF
LRKSAELVAGTVQLGLAYGAANRTGKPSRAAAVGLLRRAADIGLRQFDTARAYGDAEERLGEALADRTDIRIITKLDPLAPLPADASHALVREAVDRSIAQSLAALGRRQIDCLLLHRATHRTAYSGVLWERLIQLKEEGVVLQLGVSVQSPEEALSALDCRDVTHIQLASNLLDWRWRKSGVIARLRERPEVCVHVRSAFLQGVLAADDPDVWPAVPGLDRAI